MSPKGPPFEFFVFATECVFINQKGPPFYIFRHCATFSERNFFLENFKFFSKKKMFCAFWALDIAPTWDVPLLFVIPRSRSGINSSVSLTWHPFLIIPRGIIRKGCQVRETELFIPLLLRGITKNITLCSKNYKKFQVVFIQDSIRYSQLHSLIEAIVLSSWDTSKKKL